MTLDWGSVPDWLAAIGTIGATTTALWLARKSSRPRAELSVHPWSKDGRSGASVFLYNQGYESFSVLWIQFGAGWPRHGIYASGDFDRRPLGHGNGVSVDIDITGVVDAVLMHTRWGKMKRGLHRFSVVAALSNGQHMRRELGRWQVTSLLEAGRLRADEGGSGRPGLP